MTGYHVTTPKKMGKYIKTGAILPPVRFWPNKETAERWAKRTGRTVILMIKAKESFPLPDHVPARWTRDIISQWEKCE